MRKIYAIFFLFISMGVHSLSAQTRYLDEVFTNVNVDTSVMYGVNATVLYYSVIGQAVPQPLMMDVYSPAGDVETSRPLMIYLHSGNFLPDNYTTGGTRRDSSVVELCSRFAKMGYVVASCDYRLGWNPLDTSQDGRVTTLINAAYRGVQDCRTAVRYFRKSFQDAGNPYGIDTSRIVVTGQGTGGYIALANATLDTYTDVVLPKFTHIVQTPGGPVTLPMVLESINGDIDGTTFGTTAGFVAPGTEDTLCYPNHVGYASNVHATMNMGGALGDSSWFDAGDGPFISFQVPSDPYAPYGDGMVIVPGFNLNVVEVSGSLTVQQLAAQFGNNDVFLPMESSSINASFTAGANLHNNGLYGLYPFVRPVTQPADSSPWDWWATTDESSATGLMMNPDMSAAKGRAFCDTIQHYSAPRLMCALNLPNSPCIQSVSENETAAFMVYPNPTNGAFVISAGAGIESMVVYDSVGQMVERMVGLNATQINVDEHLSPGLYVIEVLSKGRKTTQRIVIQ
jgi:Secretion system C-terminal sorting domain